MQKYVYWYRNYRAKWIVLSLILLGAVAPAWTQSESQKSKGVYLSKESLPADFAASWERMGGRLTSADRASVAIAGTLTDSSGTRSAQIIIQAPGYLKFQNGDGSHKIAYDGTKWNAQGSKNDNDRTRIQESLLAHFPDAFFLQLANGGGLRKIGSRFRTDDGKIVNYSGPYWTLYAYSPSVRKDLKWGEALQQSQFVAIDEATWFIAEVRIVEEPLGSKGFKQVTQTKLDKWFQRDGQWYPGEIVRLENGQQVLKFTVTQGAIGAQSSQSDFSF